MDYNFFLFSKIYDIHFGYPTTDYNVQFEEIEFMFKDWKSWHYHFGHYYYLHESMELYFRVGGEDLGERNRIY